MAKLALMPLLLGAGCLAAGKYGAVHDQVSYTVSPDYFHAFKFHQFQISPHLHDRIGAAIVGWRASWWMGSIIGVPLLIAGLLLPGWPAYLKHCLIAFAVVTATALVVGFGALAYAAATIADARLPDFWYPDGPINRVAFARAGVMHNFSYLGGFLGIFSGVLYLALARQRMISPTGAADTQPPSR
jgi:hypothetical protein